MNFFKTCMKLMQLGDFTLAVVSWFSPSSGSEIDTSNLWKIYFFKISAFWVSAELSISFVPVPIPCAKGIDDLCRLPQPWNIPGEY